MASMSDTSYWINFFTSAGVPAGDAAHYAVIFSDNRITKEMLLDLSKDYLTDMGVTRLGDVIAILKHAKNVFSQEAKDKILKVTSLTSLSSSNSSRAQHRSAGISHTANNVTSKQAETVPIRKSPTPKIPPPEPAKPRRKVSVFDRLGTDGSENTISLPVNKSPNTEVQSSVFSRLGGKSALKRTSASTFFDNGDSVSEQSDSLPYAGVLKNLAHSPAKKSKLQAPVAQTQDISMKIQKTVKMAASISEDKKALQIQRPEVSTTTEGVLSDFAKKEPTSLKDRLGPKTEDHSRSTSPLSKIRATSASQLGNSKGTILNRLGTKTVGSPIVSSTEHTKPKKDKKDTTVTTVSKQGGVFSRLGQKSQL